METTIFVTKNAKQYAKLRKRSPERIGQRLRRISRLQEILLKEEFSRAWPTAEKLNQAIHKEWEGLPGVVSIGKILVGKKSTAYRYVLTVDLSELNKFLTVETSEENNLN